MAHIRRRGGWQCIVRSQVIMLIIKLLKETTLMIFQKNCLNKNEGAIEFSLNGEHYSDKNSSKLTYQPELGDIVFFPSAIHHKTIPFSTDTDRVIVSFDLKPNHTTQ